MKKHTLCLGAALYGAFTIPAFAGNGAASTDYVNNRISNAVSTLQSQIQSQLDALPKVALHQVGEFYQGGIIFYVDDTGQHGLLAATADAHGGLGCTWQNGESGERVTNAGANGIKAGLVNTQLIISGQTMDDQQGAFAALSAALFTVDNEGNSPCNINSSECYSQWYLPSLFELKLMREGLYNGGLGNFSETYWSSTEISVTSAYALHFSTGEEASMDKASTLPAVRPIRTF